jgi:hypothetical protein
VGQAQKKCVTTLFQKQATTLVFSIDCGQGASKKRKHALGLLGIVEMLVALFKVHLAAGFSFLHITGMSGAGPQFGMPGYEVNLLYIAGLASLVLSGGGAWSVDEYRAHADSPGSSETQTVITPKVPLSQ